MLMMKKPLVAILGLGITLSVVFTNCSEVAFEKDMASTIERMLTAKGGIVINNDSEFTNQKTVDLLIDSGSDEMYVTDDPTCESGGVWEPYSANKSWQLKNGNTIASVFVKFRDSTAIEAESTCRTDAIIHDDVPPQRSMTKEPGTYVQNSADMAWVASDTLSGVLKATCFVDGIGPLACDSKYSRSDLSEGPHVYTVVAWDRAGNAAAPADTGFIVDRSKPVLALSLTPPLVSGVTASTFEFAATDKWSGIKKYECRVSVSAPWTACSSPLAHTAKEGANTLYVRATDGAGNVSDESRYDWNVDLSAPSVLFTKTPNAYSNEVRAQFEFKSADPMDVLTRYECSLDTAAFATCTSPHTTVALAEGTHTFSVRGYDSVGNVSSPTTKQWIVDTTIPVATLVAVPGALISTNTANFVFDGTDNLSGIESFECLVDGGAFKTCTAPHPLKDLAEGPHSFSVRAIDRAGNASNPVNYQFAVDTTKPVVTISSYPAVQSKDPISAFAFSATDAAPGAIDRIECRLDSGNYDVCTSPNSYSDLDDGMHTFYVRAIDRAGNVSDAKQWTWLKDTLAPAINFGLVPMATMPAGSLATVQYTVADAGVGLDEVKCALDGAALENCNPNAAFTYPQLAVGNHKFTVTARDKIGNEASNETLWTVTMSYEQKSQDFQIVAANSLVDVLVVVDNSGSMATEQANMASRFSGFIDKLQGLNWQLAITTTDVRTCKDCTPEDGKLLKFDGMSSDTWILKSSMPIAAAKTAFAETIQREEQGSGYEQGIRASYRAIERAFATGSSSTNARNRSFFRQNATLAILVVTDADETAHDGTKTSNTPDGLIDLVKTKWNGQKTFTFHSIIVKPDDSVCKGKDGNEGYGYSYDSLSTKTGGIVGTVCSPDYTSQLESIGQSTAELQKSLTLACAPIDTDGDGKADVTVTLQNGGAASAYVVSGLKVTFESALPAGTARVQYSCLK